MIEVVGNCIHDFLLFFKLFLSSFFTGNTSVANYLGPAFAIGISISAILLGIKIIKSVIWRS